MSRKVTHAGGAVLAALLSGSAAYTFEKTSISEATSKVMSLLRSIYKGKGVQIPDPLQVRHLRGPFPGLNKWPEFWTKDPDVKLYFYFILIPRYHTNFIQFVGVRQLVWDSFVRSSFADKMSYAMSAK